MDIGKAVGKIALGAGLGLGAAVLTIVATKCTKDGAQGLVDFAGDLVDNWRQVPENVPQIANGAAEMAGQIADTASEAASGVMPSGQIL